MSSLIGLRALRAAVPASRNGCGCQASARLSARSYASQAGASSTNWPVILGAVGAAGLGAYAYLGRDGVTKLEHKVEEKVKGVVAEKQAGNQAPGALGALLKDDWTPFTLASVEPYNHNTKIYHFDFPAEAKDKVSGIQVAGALLVKSPGGEDEVKDDKGKPVIRPYTPISPPEQTGALTLLIKEYQGGKLTPYIAGLEPGKGQLLFKGPILKYKYEPNTFDRGLCISGGSGITPMWQLIKHSLAQPEDKTKWTLIFSNVSEKDILLRKEWDDLAKKHADRLNVNYVVDKSSWGWKGETGFITPSIISKLFPKGEDKVHAFVCGPPPQVKSISGPKDGPRQGELTGALKELGYTEAEVFKF